MTEKPVRTIACLGDFMFERIYEVPSFPATNQTLVLQSRPPQLGGTAFNLAYHLGHWGWRPKLIGFTGQAQNRLLAQEIEGLSLDLSGLIKIDGESDALLVMEKGEENRAIYILSNIPENPLWTIMEHAADLDCLVVTGSRHLVLRSAVQDIVQKTRSDIIAFSPSYAIYEYTARELLAIVRRSNLVIFNEMEATFACEILEVDSPLDLARCVSGCLLVTMAHRGVNAFWDGSSLELPSYSQREGHVNGAGDAFFAGFLHRFLGCRDVETATQFASLVAAQLVQGKLVRSRIDLNQIHRREDVVFGRKGD